MSCHGYGTLCWYVCVCVSYISVFVCVCIDTICNMYSVCVCLVRVHLPLFMLTCFLTWFIQIIFSGIRISVH